MPERLLHDGQQPGAVAAAGKASCIRLMRPCLCMHDEHEAGLTCDGADVGVTCRGSTARRCKWGLSCFNRWCRSWGWLVQAGHCVLQRSSIGIASSGYCTTEPGIVIRHKALQTGQAAPDSTSQAMPSCKCGHARAHSILLTPLAQAGLPSWSMTWCHTSLLRYRLASATRLPRSA